MEPPASPHDELLQPARRLLASQSLRGYLAGRPPRTVLGMAAGDPVGLVLRRFASAGLVAGPLFADAERTQYLGFVDLLDVVASVVQAARQHAGSPSGHALRLGAAAAAQALAGQPVGGLLLASGDAQLVLASQMDSSLATVVRQGFAEPADGRPCHRLAVLQPAADAWLPDSGDSGGSIDTTGASGGEAMTAIASSLQVTHIVSQSDILRLLHRHFQQLGQALLGSTLAELGFGGKPVMCVPSDMPVFDALAGMLEARVPAVAVVDSADSWRLIGNLSISDLRGILPEHFEQLAEPVGTFLLGGWRGSPHWQPSSPRGGVAAEFGIKSPEQLPHAPAPACCTLDSRFGEVLDALVKRSLHRLYITDGEGRPQGVVSATDILGLIAAGAD